MYKQAWGVYRTQKGPQWPEWGELPGNSWAKVAPPGEAGRRLPGRRLWLQCSEQTEEVPSLPACQPTPSLA